MTRRETWNIKAWILLTVAAGGLVAGGIVLAIRGPGQPEAVFSHGQELSGVRTVLVGTGDVAMSMPGQALHASLVAGPIPALPTMATVLSDENCSPDAMGVSHCTNRLKMDDGSMLTVVHPHRMSEVPCLAAGERVRVLSA